MQRPNPSRASWPMRKGCFDSFTPMAPNSKYWRLKYRFGVKRILKKHGFPPDLQDEATKTVLAQAELLSAVWAMA